VIAARVETAVGAYGISYGAAAAIQWAGREPRVRAVVAVASFSALRKAAARYVRLCLPICGWLMTEAQIQDAISEAGKKAGFDPELASPDDAIARTQAPVLLIHGREDFLIPEVHSRILNALAPHHTKLLLLDGEGHNSIFADRHGVLSRESLAWFDRHLR
jgi:pimeloyl-ACP methyl ester carboxylesterase